jgi:starvation-inducible DNA-binding protein
MFVSDRNIPHNPSVTPMENTSTGTTIALLDELLTHTISARDLYKSARCRTTDTQLHHLRILFDTHYKEQLRLVDVLLDRIRSLGGAGRVLAGAFLQGTQYYNAPRGRLAPNRLLCELLDVHELILSAAHAAGTNGPQSEPSAVQDFAVGQVVQANAQQGCSVREQLVNSDQKGRFASMNVSSADVYE